MAYLGVARRILTGKFSLQLDICTAIFPPIELSPFGNPLTLGQYVKQMFSNGFLCRIEVKNIVELLLAKVKPIMVTTGTTAIEKSLAAAKSSSSSPGVAYFNSTALAQIGYQFGF